MNVSESKETSFEEINEEMLQLSESKTWKINIKLNKASNLPSADLNGLNDPYCLFTILNTKISIKNRKLIKV